MALSELVQILIPLNDFSLLKGNNQFSHPFLDRITSRSIIQSHTHADSLMLYELLQLDHFAELPLARLRILGEVGTTTSETIYCADPVQLIADRDQLMVRQVKDIADDEASELILAFNQLFDGDGLILSKTEPGSWYIQFPEVKELFTQPLFKVDGSYFAHSMPQGKDLIWWRKILAEIEMLFYSHRVNQKRQDEGKAMINSLWLSGGGILPQEPHFKHKVDLMVSDDPIVKGIAKWLDIAYQPAKTFNPVNEIDRRSHQRQLVSFNELNQALASHSHQAIEAAITDLDNRLLAPCISAVKSGQLKTLELWVGHNHYRYNRQRSHYFWKQGKYLWNE